MSSAPIDGDRAPSNLAFLLSQVGTYAAQRFSARIAEAGLHPAQFRILNAVDAAAGCSQNAIGEAIGAPPSRMVALVDELEQRGLIERRPDPDDRRVRTLRLTRSGRKLLARGRKLAGEHEADLTKGMSAADRKRLIALLRKVVAEQSIGSGVHPGLSADAARQRD